MDLDFFVSTPRTLPAGAGDVVLYSTRDANRPLQSGERSTRRIAGWLQTDVIVTLKYQVWTGSAWLTYNGPSLAGDAYVASAFISFDIPRPAAGDIQIVATLGSGPTVWNIAPSLRLAVSAVPPPTGADLLRAARGLLAETFPQSASIGSIAGASGTYYFMQVWLDGNVPISSCHLVTGTAASAETFAKGALHDTSGNLLAVTADQGAGWGTLGNHSTPFVAPYTPRAPGVYYVGFIMLAGTLPAITTACSPAAAGVGRSSPLAGRPLLFGSQVGLTDVPAPLTVATGTAPAVFWMGLS